MDAFVGCLLISIPHVRVQGSESDSWDGEDWDYGLDGSEPVRRHGVITKSGGKTKHKVRVTARGGCGLSFNLFVAIPVRPCACHP